MTGHENNSALPPSLPGDFADSRRLKRELLEELRSGHEAKKPVRPEELLPRWPGEPDADADVASLLFEDYWARQGQAQAPPWLAADTR